MAGVAGRSGGGNRTMKSLEQVRHARAPRPEDAGIATADWFVKDPTNYFKLDEIYDHLAQKLHKMGISAKDDGMVLTMLAQQYLILQDATREYARDGIHAKVGQALAVRLITDAQKEIRILLGEFFLTPSTRNKKPTIDRSEDPLAAFLAIN